MRIDVSPELHRLAVSEYAPAMSACEAITVAPWQNDEGVQGPSRRQSVEGVVDRTRVVEQECSLTEVHQEKAGQTMAYQPMRMGRRPKWPMSAQSASPTTTRITAPRTRNLVNPLSAKKDAP